MGAIRSAVLLATSLLAVIPAHAGPNPPTNILYGFINANRTLTLGPPGPVYDVIGDVVVLPGVTLTIEPGVVLRMAANDTLQGGDYPTKVELTVQGTLTADGSSGDSIRILGVVPGAGLWGQIKTQSGGTATLRKAAVRGASLAFWSQGGVINVSDATITATNNAASTNSQLNLTNVTVTDCYSGVSASTGQATIRQCTLVGRGPNYSGSVGIELGTLSSVVTDTLTPIPTVVANFQTGLRVGPSGVVSNVLARDNDTGISSYGGGDPMVRYCTVVRSLGHGIFMSGGSVINSIVAQSGGYGVINSHTDYSDLWANAAGQSNSSMGSYVAGFNPFFVNPSADDFHLASHSIFKNYSNTGLEIGAYGPGGGPPVNVQQTSWGRLKRLYR